MLHGTEKGKEIEAQCLTHFEKAVGLHRLPFENAVDVLLGNTDSSPKLGFTKPEFVATPVDGLNKMHDFYIYSHKIK